MVIGNHEYEVLVTSFSSLGIWGHVVNPSLLSHSPSDSVWSVYSS